MAAQKPRTGDGPLEVTKEGRSMVLRLQWLSGSRLLAVFDTYAALLRELNAIGNNVNQLAFQANARGEATQEEIHEAVLLVREAVQLVRDTL